ncbi:hypothetical protein Taro_005512, partial [Colocasia esculenta]|nr:hypothetical protein [Colocasia esculenta]
EGHVLAVVGGGDTSPEEALYLTKYACHVHLLVRSDQLRASKAMQDRSPAQVASSGDSHVPPCPDHAIEAREADRDDDEDEDLCIHDD